MKRDPWQTQAKAALAWFQREERGEGGPMWTLKDSRPDALWYAVMEAHEELLPDDHVFAFFRDSLEAFREEGEDAHAPEPDVYTSHLLRWIASNLTRSQYVDALLEEARTITGRLETVRLFDLLQRAQAQERANVHEVVRTYLRQAMEDADAAEQTAEASACD